MGEEEIALADVLLSRRFSKGRVKELLRNHFTSRHPGMTVSARTLENIISAAKAMQVERSGKPLEAHRDDAYNFYSSMLQAADVKSSVKIKAQERIDKLLGLEAATKLELTGKNGGAVKLDLTKVPDADLEAIERALASAHTTDGDEPAGDSSGAGAAKPS